MERRLAIFLALFLSWLTAVLAQSNYEPYLFTTFAGDAGYGSADGSGSTARFYYPYGVAVDSAGNVYVADTANQTIRRITPAGVVSTLAGLAGTRGNADGTGSAARFGSPQGVAVDSAGNVYVSEWDNETIRKITPAGIVNTLAGSAGSCGSADGVGSAARFCGPWGVAVDSAGNVYVADVNNQTIRKITPAGNVSTLAGLAGTSGSADGAGSAARFLNPEGVAVDSSGYVYVADTYNSTIRKITPAGDVSTLAGLAGNSGSADGTGSAARFSFPEGVAVDSGGYIYVADTGNGTIRKITPAGNVSTLASFVGAARSVAVDSAGNVYVADTANQTIDKITPAGNGSTLAGFAFGGHGSADGTGSATRFYYPQGTSVDSAGYVYVADTQNQTIRKITPAGVVSTLAGSAGSLGSADGTGSAARFNNPAGVAVDSGGYIYVADMQNQTIRKITPTGVVSTLAGSAGSLGSADGTGNAARFNNPSGVAVDSSGYIYVADSRNGTIRKITPAGVVSTLAGLAGSSGSTDGTGSAARFYLPSGVAVDSSGYVYVADTINQTIRKITPAGVVSTLAGLAGSVTSADGTGSAARFNYPQGVAVDSTRNVYVADTVNNTIRVGAPPVQVTSTVSSKTHGSAGTFNIDLSQTGAPGIECRTGGPSNNYSILFNFVNNVSVGAANVTSGTGSVSGFSVSGNQAVVNLTGVINAQTIVITLTGVNDGSKVGYASVSMGVLVGDVNGSGVVSNTDVSLVKAQVAAPIGPANFREDVNANGVISNTDVSLTKAQVGATLPSSP